ncbi:MAG: two-component regulator propeller domain-containing protein [Bacteroidota bacterium]
MKTVIKIYSSFFLYFISIHCLFSQAYQFKNFNVDNGISQPYVYTIIQDKNGYLWTGTGEGLCKFDGVSFKSYYTKDGIAENFVTTSFKDNLRNLWLGHNGGSITFYDGKKFKSINTSGFSKSPVTCITSDEKGYIWCATQNDGVFRISKNFEVEVFKIEFNQFEIFSIMFTTNNQLLVGTDNGLMLFNLTGEKRKPAYIAPIDGIPLTKIQCIIKKNSSRSFWIGTEDKGLFLLTPAATVYEPFKSTAIAKNIPVDITNVQDVYEDNLSNLWLATFGNGVIKLLLSKNTLKYTDYLRFSEDNGFGNKYTKTIYSDHEGNIWVGTYGTGLVELTDNYFTFYSQPTAESGNNITSILIHKNIKWFGTENGLAKSDVTSSTESAFYSGKNGFVNDKVTALFLADSNHLVIGTDKRGAFQMDLSTNKFSEINLSYDMLSNSITSITGYDKTIWIATKNGLFKIEQERKIKTHYTTENGLTHNNIKQIYLDRNKNIWIATHSNYVSYIKADGTIMHKKVYDGTDLINMTGVVEDQKNNLWISSFGNGIFKIARNSITNFTTEDGLKSNYCYSIIDDGSNNIWVGHRMGLSRMKTDKNVIDAFDRSDGITGDCNYNAFFKEQNRDVWFGTTNGAIKFDPHKNKKNIVPPIINITSLKLNDKDIEVSKNITLPYDDYKLRVDFIGISFKANTRIIYQYKLDGFDVDWSDKTFVNYTQYGKLTDGKYTFLLRAYNNDGISNQVPVVINFTIEPPLWKRTWFILLLIIGVIYGFYILVKIRERNHRMFQAQLQKALNEKTREVTFQKEEIEKKNKDITDSIRYAKRIQDALLPDVRKLKTLFPESFIFFQPRDIVSGDFYWFQKYENKLIIACADATGHGVPGAFMSMIGSTLLKEVTARPEVTSPAHALEALEDEIRMMLQQDDDEPERTYDSIDLVICEIDVENYFVKICSTKRSVYASINGQIHTFKRESSELNNFETRDVQFNKGDTLYMFTDGYPDQFGGEHGKKIKMANMKEMLEQIQALPIEKQSMIVDRYFNRWKEGHDQVDDVLFIGIKF